MPKDKDRVWCSKEKLGCSVKRGINTEMPPRLESTVKSVIRCVQAELDDWFQG